MAVGTVTPESVIEAQTTVRPEAPVEAYGSENENICPDSNEKVVIGPGGCPGADPHKR